MHPLTPFSRPPWAVAGSSLGPLPGTSDAWAVSCSVSPVPDLNAFLCQLLIEAALLACCRAEEPLCSFLENGAIPVWKVVVGTSLRISAQKQQLWLQSTAGVLQGPRRTNSEEPLRAPAVLTPSVAGSRGRLRALLLVAWVQLQSWRAVPSPWPACLGLCPWVGTKEPAGLKHCKAEEPSMSPILTSPGGH